MDEAELTRMAVEEIMREIETNQDPPIPSNRQMNAQRTNKRFLNRTINSVLNHNKREDTRTRESCRRKLKELDEKQRKRRYGEEYYNGRRSRTSKEYKNRRSFSSSSGESAGRSSPQKRKRTKKRKKRRSLSRTSLKSSENAIHYRKHGKRRMPRKHKQGHLDVPTEEQYQNEVDERNEQNNCDAVAIYNQMLHFTQAVLSVEASNQQDHNDMHWEIGTSVKEEQETVISLANTSVSSSFISLSEADEVDDKGVLTINVSSDDNARDDARNCAQDANSSTTDEYDEAICISLDSQDSSDVIFTCSSTEAEQEEINVHKGAEADVIQAQIDLTD